MIEEHDEELPQDLQELNRNRLEGVSPLVAPASRLKPDGKQRPARDRQFAMFGALLWEEIAKALDFIDFGSDLPQRENFDAQMERLIARRAYDLACHILSEVSGFSNPEVVLDGCDVDMTKWPEEE